MTKKIHKDTPDRHVDAKLCTGEDAKPAGAGDDR
jgi:hypothetical protein